MRYLMKQKLFAWGDDFYIRDAEGKEVFFVDGKAFSFGDQLSFRTLDGRELAFIKQKLLSWGPAYEIWRDGALAAVVKKELFTFFNCKFTCRSNGSRSAIRTASTSPREKTTC